MYTMVTMKCFQFKHDSIFVGSDKSSRYNTYTIDRWKIHYIYSLQNFIGVSSNSSHIKLVSRGKNQAKNRHNLPSYMMNLNLYSRPQLLELLIHLCGEKKFCLNLDKGVSIWLNATSRLHTSFCFCNIYHMESNNLPEVFPKSWITVYRLRGPF